MIALLGRCYDRLAQLVRQMAGRVVPRSAIVHSKGQRLWVMSASGSRQRPLGSLDLRGVAPRWSPDGTRIAFREVGGVSALSVLDLATSKVRRLFPLGSMSQSLSYAWSPDSSWVALARQREYPCPSVDGYCEDPEVLGIRIRDGARRLFYTAADGGIEGLDWRP